MLNAELGAGPLALARAQRAQTARILIETTGLGQAEIAFASGFGSIRQFNDTIREIYGRTPSALREARRNGNGGARELGTITLRLPYREPLHAAALLEFLAARSIPGVDEVADGTTYRRGLRLPHGSGVVELTPLPAYVGATLRLSDMRDLAPAVARCRRLFDLDADPVAVDATLAADPAFARIVAKEAGVRVPRAVDGFEMAVRAVIGQQISVAGARKILSRLVATTSPPADPAGDLATDEPLRGFPSAAEVADAPDSAFGMPAARRTTLRALARAVAEDRLHLDPGADRPETEARLLEIPGIGPWTAQYVALRALGDPDVLLNTDLGVRRGAAALDLPDDPRKLAAHAARSWAPWRSYATIRLWRQQ
jgi:AraC family transcriptional regulator of adaptative response / DNA-3-methyladenine glycosylase II